ncbi:carbonic anhydrase [Marmoricola endophyticus]|uniref:carbonic anhydrase n=1 Tax=Marmoricola endophyticus TaxID=2040280 RepID=A0A917F0H0_9ACTN|nr:carbonic anhydrase [Marmoricola endophyticus]GGF32578.1 carbonic anhydrase [Marmoricola endophyticus]
MTDYPVLDTGSDEAFDDLLAANRDFAASFDGGLEGRAAKGVMIVTCMDARIDPLRVLGLEVGDAKVVRNPGGRVTDAALEAVVLGVNLLGVDRVLVVPHTSCAMAASTQDQVREKVAASCGHDASWATFGVVADQQGSLVDDVQRILHHPLVPESVHVGGFVYDVDSGELERRA